MRLSHLLGPILVTEYVTTLITQCLFILEHPIPHLLQLIQLMFNLVGLFNIVNHGDWLVASTFYCQCNIWLGISSIFLIHFSFIRTRYGQSLSNCSNFLTASATIIFPCMKLKNSVYCALIAVRLKYFLLNSLTKFAQEIYYISFLALTDSNQYWVFCLSMKVAHTILSRSFSSIKSTIISVEDSHSSASSGLVDPSNTDGFILPNLSHIGSRLITI